MINLMVFIDGTWLYSNLRHLAKESNQPGFYIDYGAFPLVLKKEIERRGGLPELYLSRTFLFGSYPVNYDEVDEERAQRRKDFFSLLREDYHYEVDAFPIDYQRRRILHDDRDGDDSFIPKEKCVDIALATSMLYYGSIQGGYDIALAVIGDKDYFPMLQRTRQIGKKVAIASIRQSCAKMYSERANEKSLKDFQIIWLNEMVEDIALKHEPIIVQCQSPLHTGDNNVATTVRLREGQPFYCDDCRMRFADQKAEQMAESAATAAQSGDKPLENGLEGDGEEYEGTIENLKPDRGFGFIKREDGNSYFFHVSHLTNAEWGQVKAGQKARFTITKEPEDGHAGSSGKVSLLIEEPAEVAPDENNHNQNQWD